MNIVYSFEALMKPVDGAMAFAKDGFIPANLEIDLQVNGADWTPGEVRMVEEHFDRDHALSAPLTGALLASAREEIAGNWNSAISYFVAAEDADEEDETRVNAWKDEPLEDVA